MRLRLAVPLAVLAGLALVPVYAWAFDEPFYVSLFTRVLILALAASSLNLILGYGGMVSFGHAAYIGVGGYTVGILAHHGVVSGFVQWPLAVLLSALVALAIGALCLRTRGLYFIMITLAFAQMLYYLASGSLEYGGDDGLPIRQRSAFGGGLDIADKTTFYYLCFVLLAAALWAMHRLVGSRFGMALRGARSNERRMQAIGFPTFRYKLAGFVIAGAACGLAGALLANHTDFISPDLMHWTRSGDLIVMVVLGGMGALFGPLLGAFAFLAIEEALSRVTEYWQLVFGPLLVLVVLFGRGGLDGLLGALERRRG